MGWTMCRFFTPVFWIRRSAKGSCGFPACTFSANSRVSSMVTTYSGTRIDGWPSVGMYRNHLLRRPHVAVGAGAGGGEGPNRRDRCPRSWGRVRGVGGGRAGTSGVGRGRAGHGVPLAGRGTPCSGLGPPAFAACRRSRGLSGVLQGASGGLGPGEDGRHRDDVLRQFRGVLGDRPGHLEAAFLQPAPVGGELLRPALAHGAADEEGGEEVD